MRKAINNITLSPEQQTYVRQNIGRFKHEYIAAHLNITVSTLKNNLSLMGLTKKREAAEADVEKPGCFSWKEFAQCDIIFQTA